MMMYTLKVPLITLTSGEHCSKVNNLCSMYLCKYGLIFQHMYIMGFLHKYKQSKWMQCPLYNHAHCYQQLQSFLWEQERVIICNAEHHVYPLWMGLVLPKLVISNYTVFMEEIEVNAFVYMFWPDNPVSATCWQLLTLTWVLPRMSTSQPTLWAFLLPKDMLYRMF